MNLIVLIGFMDSMMNVKGDILLKCGKNLLIVSITSLLQL